MNEEITMRELLELLVEESNKSQQRFESLQSQIKEMDNQLTGRLDSIEVRLVEKNDFNRMIGVLENKELVSPSEAATLLVTDRKTF